MAIDALIFLLWSGWWEWAGALSESRTWALQQPLFESVLPIDHVWDVAGRYHRDLYVDERESWFCIGDDMEGRLVAEVRLPGETSFVDQLALAWLRHRGKGFEELRSELVMDRHVVPVAECPRIGAALATLEAIELRAMLADETIILHPPVWEVHVPGLNQSLTVRASSPDHPVATWYEQTLAALLDCLHRAPEENPRELPFPPHGPTVCGTDVVVR